MATRNPANSPVEGTVVYPSIYDSFSTIQPGGWPWDFSHQQYSTGPCFFRRNSREVSRPCSNDFFQSQAKENFRQKEPSLSLKRWKMLLQKCWEHTVVDVLLLYTLLLFVFF